jgi:hypothetical protein
MADDKVEGPARELVFLGIVIDTVKGEARLDERRLEDLRDELKLWANKRTASVKEIRSLVGTLTFATRVVRVGRCFVRRMLDHVSALPAWPASRQHALSAALQADVCWWQRFIGEWNGISILYEADWSDAAKLRLYTDACSAGYGGVYQRQWFAGAWTAQQEAEAQRDARDSMPWKELFALVTAAATWGSQWQGMKVEFFCDCLPVVQALHKLSSKRPAIMQLIRTLLLIAAQHQFAFRVRHVAGSLNCAADALSRGNVQMFMANNPQAERAATAAAPLPECTW